MTSLWRFTAAAGLVLACTASPVLQADALAGDPATLAVRITDRQGAPVDDVVVYAEPAGGSMEAEQPERTAVMDQIDARFVPHILVVRTGTRISFPNSDTVSHHVYSFSEPKPFELPLYKGTTHPPVQFDTPGLVVVGCNIHDNMLGYIVVLGTPHYAITDEHGRAILDDLRPGEYAVHVWTPRLRAKSLPAARTITLTDAENGSLAFGLTEKLFPPHAPAEGTLTWSAY